jgi:arylformamidase
MPVFGPYDQTALDLQYDSAARDPSLAPIRDKREAERSERGRELRQTVACKLDIAYGEGARELLDVFLCGQARAPLFVMIHGGYWRAGDKQQAHFLAEPFVGRGINFAAISYPLAPAASLTQIVDSVRRAIVFLHKEAARLGFDPARIHVGGHSAGGHLAAMMLATDWTSYKAPADLVRSATAVSGLYDLRPFPLLKRKPDLQFTEQEIAAFSPVRLRPVGKAPLILTVGADESAEFLRNRAELGTAWRDGLAFDGAVPGANHFNVLDALLIDSDLQRAVMRAINAA